LSVKPFEFDIGWLYIRLLESVGWAKVRKTPPKLALGTVKTQPDKQTLQALIANRYEVMAKYAAEMQRAVRAELQHLKDQGAQNSARWKELRLAKTWLHRDADKIPQGVKAQLAQTLGSSPKLAKLVAMREELRQLWTRTNVSAEQLVADLQAWCRRAEDSGIAALQDFSMRLRSAHA
jgi:stearoyl-CoA desaturase (delta-9 desaturase)